jgi:hypothetical protein
MSLRTDRALSQAWRYARNRQSASTAIDKLRAAVAYSVFAAQFDTATRKRMHEVYTASLAGEFFEDKRSRGVTYR